MTTSEAKQSLALKLKNARKSRRISVPKLAKILSVPDSTIESIESQEGSDLPLANLVGLSKRYAQEVKLDYKEIAEELAILKPAVQSRTKKTHKTPSSRIFVASRATYALVAGMVLVVVLGYALWQAWQLSAAPDLELYQPQDNVIVQQAAVEVSGKASPDASLTINGSSLGLADNGEFSTTVYVQPGQNFLQVRAINALGHEAVEDRNILYNP